MTADHEQGRAVPDEERTRQILEQLKSVHAFDVAYETMVGLVNFGSQKMGLLEETREVRDLEDARLSIELIRAILEVIEPGQDPERTRGLHDALAQMQLSYAHAVQLANAERAAAREPAPGRAAEPPVEGREDVAEPDGPAGDAGRAAEPTAGEPEDAAEPASETERAEEPAEKPAPKKKPAVKKKPAPKKKPAGEA